MKDLNKISEELFSKIRGKYKNVTIGNEAGEVTNIPAEGRFFEFEFNNGKKVSISLDEKSIAVMYSEKLFDDGQDATKSSWFSFLKELREFARKRLLNFDTRDIQKTNLDRRDYKFLSKNNTSGEGTMTESKLYGTSRLSYQDVDNARIVIKHTDSVAENRNIKIGSIYIENNNSGERFKYPFRHINGARAMARHVSEGGNPYDDFGKHIVGLSEELNKLRKFMRYMSRSGVMAEGLAQYMNVVDDRVNTVKETIMKLQRKTAYTEAVKTFETKILEEVPEDVAGDWIDQLTIRQFNEELKDVFPYIYRLVSEASAVKELGPEDLLGEGDADPKAQALIKMFNDPNTDKAMAKQINSRYQKLTGKSIPGVEKIKSMDERSEYEKYRTMRVVYDPETLEVKKTYPMMHIKQSTADADKMGLVATDGKEYLELRKKKKGMDSETVDIPTTDDIESAFEKMMGQFSDKEDMPIAISPDGKMEPMGKGDGSDDERPEPKVSLPEKILSLFDKENGTFPKGETAVLTMVEKDYGEDKIEMAKEFIERIKSKYEEVMIPMEPQVQEKETDREKNKRHSMDLDDLERDIRKSPAGMDPDTKKHFDKKRKDLAMDKVKMNNSEEVETLKSLAGIH